MSYRMTTMNEINKNPKIIKYILREREKKTKEMFESQAMMRAKREEELKRNKYKMSLEEICGQLESLENKLSQLKAEKHQLFSQLKKVLNEDEMRRRQRESEQHQQQQHLYQQQQHVVGGGASALFNAQQLQQFYPNYRANAHALYAPNNNNKGPHFAPNNASSGQIMVNSGHQSKGMTSSGRKRVHEISSGQMGSIGGGAHPMQVPPPNSSSLYHHNQ